MLSFRRKPESSFINKLKLFWTPVFTGVTTFYEAIIFYSFSSQEIFLKDNWFNDGGLLIAISSIRKFLISE